jgi:hypothetical protein
MTCLAALAVAGVLLMHGLDAVAADLADTGHHGSQEERGPIHGAVGMCVFVIAAVGMIGAAIAARGRRGFHVPVPRPADGTVAVARSDPGRLRHIELCVMRT